ncbi:MAG: glycosyltransferase family 4 protein [Acidobacteriota bacterium]|nr:glycosyltransferase family 4 protein [Acidobacteriota bacterium]
MSCVEPMTLGILLRNVPWAGTPVRGNPSAAATFLRRLWQRRGPAQGSTIFGAHVAAESIIGSLARYGTIDRYRIFTPPHLVSALKSSLGADAKTFSVHGFYDISRVAGDVTAWFDPWPNFGILSYCRSTWSRRMCPVTVLFHALSYARILRQNLLQILLADSFPFDSLVCPSAAAMRAERSLLETVAASLERNTGIRLAYHGRLDLIPHGVDTDLFKPRDKLELRLKLGLPRKACIILFLGRLSFIDKADLFPLLFAFKDLAEKRAPAPKPFLVLAGSDPAGYARALEDFARELGLRNSVKIIRRPSEAHLLLAAADIFVSPTDSLQESFGLSVIEAMACGTPQVVSDWDGYRETVRHGVTGFLVPTYWARSDSDICDIAPLFGNEWDYDHALLAQSVAVDNGKLRGYLEALIANPGLRSEMSKNSRARAVSQFSWRVIVKQWEDLWRELSQCAGDVPMGGTSRMSYARPAYFEAFNHYATEVLSDESQLRMTPLGRKLLAGRTPGLDTYPSVRTGLIEKARLLQTLSEFNSTSSGYAPPAVPSGRKTLGEVAEALMGENTRHARDLAKRQVFWLLKQGYVELAAE